MAEPPEMADTDPPAMDQPDEDESDWYQSDGDQPEGDQPEGDQPDGKRPDGDQPDGVEPDGERPDEDGASLERAPSPALASPTPAAPATATAWAPALGQDESPGELELILARLIAADIAEPAALAQLLGVDEPFIGRPQRALLRVGIVAADATGALHLTPRGEAWLQLPPVALAPVVEASIPALPELDPLPTALEPLPERSPKTSKRKRGPKLGFGLPRAALAWTRVLPAPLRRLRVPGVRLPGFVPSGLVVRRRLALVGASALLIIVAGKTGLYSFGSASATAAQAPFANVKATATPWKIADLTTPPPPTSTPDAARWMVVQHTNGLGLVLRPEPASTARVTLLQDGARLRVTGNSVEQGGHAWWPVTSPSGASGWVAGEFVAPDR